MNAVITNIRLKHWKIVESDMCTFCNLQRESIRHLMYECKDVICLWRKVAKMCDNMGLGKITINYRNIMLNAVNSDPGHVANFVILIVKQYIYSQRCLKKSVCDREVENLIYRNRNIEKFYALKNNKLKYHHRKWGYGASTDLIVYD